MGVSTNAVIFYGILIDEDGCECQFNDVEDINEHYAKKIGWVSDDGGLFTDGNYTLFDNQADEKKARKIWEKNRDELHKITGDCDVELAYHCSGEYPMHYVGVKESETFARRGYPVQLDEETLNIEPDWADKLKDYCKIMDIEYKEPSWHLVSYWDG